MKNRDFEDEEEHEVGLEVADENCIAPGNNP